jgi:hypothetical protein
VKNKAFAACLTIAAVVAVPACSSKSKSAATVTDDPVWGPAAVICPTGAPDPSAPALLGTDCDPLDPTYCGLPFPSNVYLSTLSTPPWSNPSGMSVTFGATTLPQLFGSQQIDPSLWTNRDGFSTLQAAVAHFPNAVSVGTTPQSTLPDLGHIANSTDPANSPTLLLEATSGSLMAHMSEVDVNAKDPTTDALLIRPQVRLKDQTRYIVAIRNVQDGSGNTIPPPPFFKALLDQYNGNSNPCSPAMAALRKSQYADIFSKLQAAGVDLPSLQMAWDYTTSSSDSSTQDLVFMRDDALKNYPSGFKFNVYKATVNPSTAMSPWNDDDEVWIRIDATMTLPLYLNFAQPYDPKSPNMIPQVNRGSDGKPLQNGEFDFPIVIHVPMSAQPSMNPPKNFGLVQNGHGLLGDRFEGSGAEGTPPPRNFLTHLGNVYHYVTFATNLMGFASDVDVTQMIPEDDTPLVEAGLSGDPKYILALFQRQEQGHLNQLLAMRFMKQNFTQLVADPLVSAASGGGLDPTILDPTLAFYRGDSQGGIMGGVYMALSPDISRGLLGETGMPYDFLLQRSEDWSNSSPSYALLFNGPYQDGRAQQIVLGLFQMWWDTTEPTGYDAHITSNPLPCASCAGGTTPVKNVLLYDGIGDCQVTSYSAHIVARTVGAQQLSPVAREIYGITDAPSITAPGSGIVEWSFGLPAVPLTNSGPQAACCGSGNDPHDKISLLQPAYDQLDHFYRTGDITPYCMNICSCYEAPMYPQQSNCSVLDTPNWMGTACGSGM